MQGRLELDDTGGRRTLALGEDCHVDLYDLYPQRTRAEADRLQLLAELPWVQEIYRRPGVEKCIPAPRWTAFIGDDGCDYTYADLHYAPHPWSPLLSRLRRRVEAVTGQPFNCVLANLYRDGQDSVGYHADDEPELGPSRDNIVVASLSLGAERRFVLKHRRTGVRTNFELGHGRLLVMRGQTQHRYIHALPKTKRPVGPRLNLTFRVVV